MIPLTDCKRIDLRQIAAHYGWVVDKAGGKGTSTQMRQPDGSREIVVTRAPDGHWLYFARLGDRGTVVDFFAAELNLDIVAMRRELDNIRHSLTEPATISFSLPPSSRATTTTPTISHQRASMTAEEYLASRGISPETVQYFGRSITLWRDCVQFPHTLADGHGCEYRGAGKQGFSTGGHKGAWTHLPPHGAQVIIVTESGIDALSYHQLYPQPDNGYCSTGGATSPAIWPTIAYLAYEQGASIVAGQDNDTAGARMSEELIDAARRQGVAVNRHLPSGKDWNDDLINTNTNNNERKI